MMKQALLALILVITAAACAPAPEQGEHADVLEPLNRQIFAFNEVVDTIVLEPVARGYRFVTPEPARKGVRNALRNLGEPVIMANALMQGDVTRFFASGWRFVLNSTLGLGGLYDFAGEYGNLDYRKEDFGQTMAVWADEKDSAYLVLPILGPSTTRDAFGRVVDAFMNPWYYALETEESIALTVAEGISGREAVLDTLDEVYRTSLDPYTTIRSAYEQRRVAEIENRYSEKE